MTYLLILLALVFLVIIAVGIRIFHGFKPPLSIESGTPADLGLVYEQAWIPTKKNRKLFGWFIPSPAGDSANAPTLVMVHGWGGNAEFALPLALPFRDSNINLLLFDHRNHGKSDRSPISTIGTISEDVDAAIDWVRTRQPKASRIALMGHSIGAAAALHRATQRKDIDAVISLSTFAHIRKIVAVLLRNFGVMKPHVPAVIRIIERLIGHSLDDMAPVNTVQKLHCPALIIHATADDTINHTDFEEICRTVIENNISGIRCLSLEGGEHFPLEEITAKSGEIITFLQEHNVL